MIRIPPEALHSWSTEVLAASGVPDNDATHIARCLIDVDLRGVRSHGTRQLRRYVKEFRNGLVNTTPVIRVLRETDHSLRLDGDGGAGYLVASRATDSTCDKTNAVGLAVAATCNHGHVGSAGIYARRVLSHGFIGWCVAGGAAWNRTDDPDATVWDAMRAPPMCFAVPSDDGGPPLVLDMNANQFSSAGYYEGELAEKALVRQRTHARPGAPCAQARRAVPRVVADRALSMGRPLASASPSSAASGCASSQRSSAASCPPPSLRARASGQPRLEAWSSWRSIRTSSATATRSARRCGRSSTRA